MERIYVTPEQLEQIEQRMILQRHVERYAMVRQHLHGRVLDCACGVGYGTYLCAKNPDVTEIVGLDISSEAVAWAAEHFHHPNLRYLCGRIEDFSLPGFDVLVSLETIEHLEDPSALNALVERCGIDEVLLSFPVKKTTHYNKFHRWDLTLQDVRDAFPGFLDLWSASQMNEFCIAHFVRKPYRSAAPPRRPGRQESPAQSASLRELSSQIESLSR
jgi:SAM-dependent methyltransferase